MEASHEVQNIPTDNSVQQVNNFLHVELTKRRTVELTCIGLWNKSHTLLLSKGKDCPERLIALRLDLVMLRLL